MNSIKVRATTAAYSDVYDINVETSADCTPAFLHTVGRLLEGFGCISIQQLTIINGKGEEYEQ